MPRDITVTLNDGQTVVYKNAPDDVTPEQVSARASQEHGKAVKSLDGGRAAAPQSKLGEVWDGVKSGAADLARGALRGAAGMFEGMANQQTAAFAAKELGLPKFMQEASPLTDAVNQAMPTPQGDSVGRKYLRAGLEGVGGAATTGPRSVTNLVSGAGAGLGGEAGNNMAPGNPLAGVALSVAGGLIPGGAAALASRARPQSSTVAREMVEGFTPEQLRQGQAYVNQQAARGVNLDLAQGLEALFGYSGNVGNTRDFVATRSQGNRTAEILRQQPEQLAREAQMAVAGMPGKNYSPEQNANNLQETATGRLQMAREARSDEVRGLYAKAADLPAEARGELIRILQKDVERAGASTLLKERANTLIKKLSGADDDLEGAVEKARMAVEAAKTPAARAQARVELAGANAALTGAKENPLRALDVDTAISEFRGPWQGIPLKQAYPKEQGEIKGLAGMVNKKFQDLSPEVKAAEARFKQITDDTINPLKQGPVGTVNQARSYDPATQAMVSKFDGILNRGTDPTAQVSSIRTLGKELAKKDPAAFEDSFKGWLSNKIKPATAEGVGTSPLPSDPQMASQLWSSLFKDGHQWQGIKDAASVMAEVRGQKPEELLRGLENFRQLTKAMTSRPSAPAGASPQDLARMGGDSALASAVGMFGMVPVTRIREGMIRATLGKTLAEFDNILTSPKGADMIIELGKVPVMSKKAQVILGTWGGMTGNSDGLPENNTP